MFVAFDVVEHEGFTASGGQLANRALQVDSFDRRVVRRTSDRRIISVQAVGCLVPTAESPLKP